MKKITLLAALFCFCALAAEQDSKPAKKSPRIFGTGYNVTFPNNLDCSACAGKPLTFNSEVVIADESGNFSTIWEPANAVLSVNGTVTATTFTATLACITGQGPTGTIDATGDGTTFSGTYTFGTSTGAVSIKKSTVTDTTVSVNNPSLTPNPAKVGDTVTFKGEVVSNKTIPDTAQAAFNFGDGTASLTLSAADFASLKKDGVTHVYQSAGVFVIRVHFSNAATPNDPGFDYSITEVVGDASASVDQSTGASVISQVGAGGAVTLTINAQSVNGASGANTTFEDASGAQPKERGTLTGFNVSQTLGTPGLYVATTTLTDNNGKAVGMTRKTVGVAANKVTPGSLPNPASIAIGIKTVKGKFTFDASHPDVVTFSGQIQLPPGFSLQRSDASTLQFSMGNVIDTVQLDEKGKATPGTRGRIKKVQLRIPKLPNGTAVGGEVAQISVQYNVANLSASGFNTDGITGVRGVGETGVANRLIQVNLMLGGVAFESLAPVNYVISKDGAFGSISGRK